VCVRMIVGVFEVCACACVWMMCVCKGVWLGQDEQFYLYVI